MAQRFTVPLAIIALSLASQLIAQSSFNNEDELKALIEQCVQLEHGQPEQAIELINPVLEQGDIEQYPFLKVRALGCRAWSSSVLGRGIEVDQDLNEMEQIGLSLIDPEQKVESISMMASINQRQNNPEASLAWLKQALDIALESDLQTQLVSIYTNLGIEHSVAENHDLAIEHYQLALEMIEQTDDERNRLPILYNMGLTYRGAGELDLAIDSFEQLLEPLQTPGMEIRLASLLTVMASIYREQGQLDKAEALYEQSIELHQNLNNPAERTALLIDLGYLSLDKNDVNAALDYSTTALATARESELSMSVRGALNLRARALEVAGRPQDALEVFREYNALNEEFLQEQQRSALNQIQAELGFERQAVELAELRAQQQLQSYEINQQRLRQQYAIVIGGLVLIALMLAFMWQRRTNRRLKQLSQTDQLTGLPNRRRIMDFLSDTIHASNAENYVLMLLDLDYFKQINDAHGHDVGDRALVEVADQLRAFALSRDVEVGRWGGEEFLILFKAQSAEQAMRLASELLDRVASIQPKGLTDKTPVLTASAGFVPIGSLQLSNDQRIWEPALLTADQLLYRAKKAGRNGFFGVWPSSLKTKTTPSGLNAALQSGQYQLLHKTI